MHHGYSRRERFSGTYTGRSHKFISCREEKRRERGEKGVKVRERGRARGRGMLVNVLRGIDAPVSLILRYCRQSMDASDAWMSQFKRHRLVFLSAATKYWLTTIEYCHNDTRLLWSKVGRLLQLGDVSQSHHTAADLATHFTSKVDNVRQATTTAKAPVINQRQSSTFDVFQPVTTDEVLKLLSKAPTKHCQLDPIPIWLASNPPRSLHRFLPPCATHLSKVRDSRRQRNMTWSLLA